MIEFLDAPDHVVATRVVGRMSDADVQALRALVEDKLTRNPRIATVGDITAVQGVTLKAWAMDIRFGMFKSRNRKRFPREAVISASASVRAVAKVLGPLAPRVERRVFAPGDEAAAMTWAADILPKD